MNPFSKALKGFTLIEILITIVILAILAGITIVALNPGQNIDDANDVRRKSDVSTILNGVWQYAVSHNGQFPAGVSATEQNISNLSANICADLVPSLLARLPADPTTGSYTDCTAYALGYKIKKDATGKRLTVSATLSNGSTYKQER
jgi:prepilin-type N-terminal cleavage/methylation domain-containing protein